MNFSATLKSREPVVGRSGGRWLGTPQSMGPFGGMHGGVVSGLLVGELEAMAAAKGYGQPTSASVHLVRPAPLEAFETKIDEVRAGARLAVYDNSLIAGGKLRAKATVGFMKDVPVPGIQQPRSTPTDVSALPAWTFKPHFETETYLRAVEVREDKAGGTIWMRPTRPLTPDHGAFAQVIAIADFATLFEVYLYGVPQAGGWPNADIAVHLARPPRGEWVGVRPRSDWYPNGMGMTEAELFDVDGWIGRSCQSVALMPLGAGPMNKS